MQRIGNDRREFIAKSLCLAEGSCCLRSGSNALRRDRAARDPPSERYGDSFITERTPFKWPGNNTLAVCVREPNVQVWHYDSAFGVGISPNPNGILSAGRASTMRGGIWNYASACGVSPPCSMRRASRRPSLKLGRSARFFPSDRGKMKKRGWEFMGPRHHQLEDAWPASLQSRS